MGRLLNPGLGELVDRLTILRLKILHAPDPRDTMHFHTEQAQVQMLIDRVHQGLHVPLETHTKLGTYTADLHMVNRKLWALEDRMAQYAQSRLYYEDHLADVGDLGISIWHANRDRNTLIREINALAGTDVGPEKL